MVEEELLIMVGKPAAFDPLPALIRHPAGLRSPARAVAERSSSQCDCGTPAIRFKSERTLDPESDLNFILAILDTILARIGPQSPALAMCVIWCPRNCCSFVVPSAGAWWTQKTIETSDSDSRSPPSYPSLQPAIPRRILCS